MFTARLPLLPATLPDFAIAPPAQDRTAWKALPEFVAAQLMADGDAALAADYPQLTATHYLAYTRTGDRAGFEAGYFARRRLLNALILAECVEHDGRFLDRIVDGLLLLCEESGWQLPAHNAQVRNGARAALPDVTRPIIDLFAAETGAQLAVAAQMLGAELEIAAPGLVARIDAELERRIFTPYLTRHFWWMGNGDEPMNNWTAWCTQNLLIAAFARPLAAARRRDIVGQAARSLDAFLKDYAEDGACEEGVLYYRHAGLCLFNALTILAAVAPTAFAPLRAEPKLRNIAEYIVHMHVAGRRYFNFADSSAVVEGCGAREFLFGRAVGSALLADFAAADWAVDRRVALPDEINLFYRLQVAFAAAEMAVYRPGPVPQQDCFLPSVGLLAAGDGRFALAVKAGDNGESHNHNDVGSVTLYKDGQPVLIDVGVETYTARTFSAERYDIWTMQSAWHNLPSFGGVMQHDGAAFAARDVEVTLAAERAAIEMDIAGAYPPEAALRAYRRRVVLERGAGVEIEDFADGDLAAELSLMFARRPELAAGEIVLPGLATIAVTGAGAMRLEEVPIADARLRQAWPDRLYRVLLPFAGGRLRLLIT
ncbi:MAG: heparinase [Devosia sp. 67-54]|uniref:heparinase II/III domain-containing protein n=1 Tax=unclassified Devosia TaxID=196773 RepID=UPI00095A1FEC|nr:MULTISPECIES: heparinase II/III family protein [unclassified Devosia]MBN9305733.1 heparinase II/III family protein [Devosia sp.]OJX16551.1 MAG: heparinase [Devosia sp. 67-54]